MRPVRSALVAAVVVPMVAVLSAQQSPSPTPAGAHQAAMVTTDVVYGHKAGMTLTFDVYRPRTPNGAAVISVLSAGWRSGWDSLQQFQEQPDGSARMMTSAAIVAAPGVLPSHSYVGLLEKGFTVFAVRHGSSPTFGMPDIVSDLRRAVRVIKRKAHVYGVDPNRIGLWGGSAGGHLSLLLGTSAEIANANAKEEVEQGPAKVAAIVAYAPPTDLVTQWAHWTQSGPQQFAAVNMSDADRRTYSPMTYVSADDPPTLIVHGNRDATVPFTQGQSMSEALATAGVPSRLLTIENAGHGFFGEDAKRVNAAMVAWFEEYLLKQ
jgi:dienelactone hydrolase